MSLALTWQFHQDDDFSPWLHCSRTVVALVTRMPADWRWSERVWFIFHVTLMYLLFDSPFSPQTSLGCCVASRYPQPGPVLGVSTHSLTRPSALVCSIITTLSAYRYIIFFNHWHLWRTAVGLAPEQSPKSHTLCLDRDELQQHMLETTLCTGSVTR